MLESRCFDVFRLVICNRRPSRFSVAGDRGFGIMTGWRMLKASEERV